MSDSEQDMMKNESEAKSGSSAIVKISVTLVLISSLASFAMGICIIYFGFT